MARLNNMIFLIHHVLGSLLRCVCWELIQSNLSVLTGTEVQ